MNTATIPVKHRALVRGFTLIELMIVVVIIAALAAIAIPAYLGYIGETQETKLMYQFNEAVNAARAEFAKEASVFARGRLSSRPTTEAGWMDLLAKTHGVAPGGGDSFIFGGVGDKTTGAIGVAVPDDGQTLLLARPAFRTLPALIATITGGGAVGYNLGGESEGDDVDGMDDADGMEDADGMDGMDGMGMG